MGVSHECFYGGVEMTDKKSSENLNIFLVKKGINRSNKIIKENEVASPLLVKIRGCGEAKLYIKKTDEKYPKWKSLFDGWVDIDNIGKCKSISAALLIKVSGRNFVLVFGISGRHLVNNDVYEERFGLIVALNSVCKDSFRCVDKQSLNSIESQTRVQSAIETTADQFGLDVEQDMLKAVVGVPENMSLGSRMTGSDSLSVTVKMDLTDIKYLLNSYKELFESELNGKEYQWVNNISAIKSTSTVVSDLNEALLKKFKI